VHQDSQTGLVARGNTLTHTESKKPLGFSGFFFYLIFSLISCLVDYSTISKKKFGRLIHQSRCEFYNQDKQYPIPCIV
jgi:hypothetical protein